jgi:hypothetical protein
MIACPVCRTDNGLPSDALCQCPNCAHIFQFPCEITVRYDASYVSTYDSYPTEMMAYLRVGFLKAFVRGGRLLDVGYGNGDFVRAAAAAGFDAYGSEIHGVDCGIREVVLATDDSRWNVVTFFDSLEHFPEFELVRDLLRRTHYVMVSLPKRPRTFPRDRAWRHFKPGEHLHYFSELSLQHVVQKPLLALSDIEDAIRRGSSPGQQNILTAVFGHS